MKRNISVFWKSFFHIRVYVFILVGTCVMFLTFLTRDNGLELMISALASVFIGIGVNNYSSMYTYLQDKRKSRTTTRHSVKFMKLMQNRIHLMKEHCENGRLDLLKEDFTQLEQAIGLTIEMITENEK